MLKGGQPDHLPLMPITMMFAADRIGVKYGDYVRTHEVLVEGQIRTAEEFGFDHVSSISDPAREAADYGAHVQWYADQPPALMEEVSLLADKGKLAVLKPIDPLGGRRMHDRILAIESLKGRVGAEKFVEGWIEGPCAEAADLRGINRLMLDFHDNPVFAEELFGFVVENAIACARAQIAAGADIIGVGDAAASLVGPRVYDKFVWPYEKELVDGIHAAGGRVRLHICGNTRRILAGMGKLGCELVDLDYPVDLRQAREIMGPDQVLAGNIEPVGCLRNGTPDSVTEAVAKCHEEAGPRYIVAAGCEVVRDTPIENLRALCEYAKSHGCGGEYVV
jgi:MtaA/CmuA family methyltransferase